MFDHRLLDPGKPLHGQERARHFRDPLYDGHVDDWLATDTTPETGRLLLFGALNHRKGVTDAIDACRQLHASGQKITLSLLGSVTNYDRSNEVVDAIAEGERDGFVEFTPGRYSDEMLREELARAQLVLLPYFRHHGSSGSLVCSAAAHRPVVASNYGLSLIHI